jgi:serine/threonine protein kinase
MILGPDCTKGDVETFIKESARMRGLSHQHILTIIGVLTKDNKPFIILPYMENGDLKTYIADKSRVIKTRRINRFYISSLFTANYDAVKLDAVIIILYIKLRQMMVKYHFCPMLMHG